LAFVDDELRAAVGNRTVADPFYRTAEVVDMLRVQAGQEQVA
jgi:hypothetical protein